MNLCSGRISHHRAQKAQARHGESFGPMSAVFEFEKMRSSPRKNLEDWLLEHIRDPRTPSENPVCGVSPAQASASAVFSVNVIGWFLN